MKVVYIVYNKLHFYPPCVSQIRMIKKLGYDIDVIYGNCDEKTIKILSGENINCINLNYNNEDGINKFVKIYRILKFRKKLLLEINKYNKKKTLFWFGNAESALTLKGKMNNMKYVLSLLELYDEKSIIHKLLHGVVEKSNHVTTCEETRGYLTKYWYGLDYLPTILPNKSYKQLEERNYKGSCDLTKKIIDDIKHDNIIIYQGYINDSKELVAFADALNEVGSNYKLLLIGIDKNNIYKKIKKIYSNTVFYSYIPAPLHLEITSHAKIGILFYNDSKLNNAYCAPNKIYEYSAFGIPIIGNNIPGLKNTIGAAKAGICIELEKNKIIDSILKIERNYKEYSQNSRKFYDSCDNLNKIKNILDYERESYETVNKQNN